MRRTASMVAVLTALAMIAGCRNDSQTGPTAAVAGTYQMKTMNGASLPYSIAAGSLTLQVTRDVLVLNADGSYVDSTTYQIPGANGASQISTSIERGTYKYSSNGSITFVDATAGGSTYRGSIAGTTLTESVNGATPVYERQ